MGECSAYSSLQDSKSLQLGVRVGGHLALTVFRSEDPKWTRAYHGICLRAVDDRTINIVLCYCYYYYYSHKNLFTVKMQNLLSFPFGRWTCFTAAFAAENHDYVLDTKNQHFHLPQILQLGLQLYIYLELHIWICELLTKKFRSVVDVKNQLFIPVSRLFYHHILPKKTSIRGGLD